jgi:hypothetical protein
VCDQTDWEQTVMAQYNAMALDTGTENTVPQILPPVSLL